MTPLVLGLLGWCLAGVAVTLALAGVLRLRDLRDPRGSAGRSRHDADPAGWHDAVVDLTTAGPSLTALPGRGPQIGDDVTPAGGAASGGAARPGGDDDAPASGQPPADLPRAG